MFLFRQNEGRGGLEVKNKKSIKITISEDRSRPGDFDSDPMGSYTGCPSDPYELPIQDADDL